MTTLLEVLKASISKESASATTTGRRALEGIQCKLTSENWLPDGTSISEKTSRILGFFDFSSIEIPPKTPCAVRRHGLPAGANPARPLSLQPVAIGAAAQGGAAEAFGVRTHLVTLRLCRP